MMRPTSVASAQSTATTGFRLYRYGSVLDRGGRPNSACNVVTPSPLIRADCSTCACQSTACVVSFSQYCSRIFKSFESPNTAIRLSLAASCAATGSSSLSVGNVGGDGKPRIRENASHESGTSLIQNP